MKKRELLAMALAAVTAMSVLGGCGSASQDTATVTGETTEAAVESSSETAGGTSEISEESAESEEKVTIRVALWDYSNTQYYKTMFEEFTAQNPDIEIEPVEFTAGEYGTTLTTQLSGKQDFDVVFVVDVPSLSALTEQGHLMPLDEFMNADENFNKDAYAGLVEQLQVDDVTYAIPFRKDNNLIFYNKDLFDAAGVAYPEDGMTLEEYHDLAAQMTSGEGNDKVYGAHIHTWATNVYNYARRVEDFNQFDIETYMNLKPYYEEFLEMQDEGIVMDYGSLVASNIHYSGVFYNQQAAMLEIGTWFINNMCENVTDFNWGVCSLPNPEGLGNENAVGGVTPVAIGAYSKHPQEAWRLISYICGEEGAKVLANTGIVPAYDSEAIAEIFDSIPETHPNAPENLSEYIGAEKYVIETGMNSHASEINNIIGEQHSAIMTKSVTVDEGLQQMYDRVAEVLAQ